MEKVFSALIFHFMKKKVKIIRNLMDWLKKQLKYRYSILLSKNAASQQCKEEYFKTKFERIIEMIKQTISQELLYVLNMHWLTGGLPVLNW